MYSCVMTSSLGMSGSISRSARSLGLHTMKLYSVWFPRRTGGRFSTLRARLRIRGNVGIERKKKIEGFGNLAEQFFGRSKNIGINGYVTVLNLSVVNFYEPIAGLSISQRPPCSICRNYEDTVVWCFGIFVQMSGKDGIDTILFK